MFEARQVDRQLCGPWQLAADLESDGFAVVENIAGAHDLVEFRAAVAPLLADQRAKRRELGEWAGTPQIIEIEHITEARPELLELDVIRYAKAISADVLKAPVEIYYDQVIYKPPMNMKETAWHQDFAYGRWLTFSARRLHWWLPLHDVDADQSCMRFVPGSHKIGYLPHGPAAPISDALKTELPADAEAVTCPLKAGSAAIHLPATLHCTGPNMTKRSSTALVLQFAARNWLTRLARWTWPIPAAPAS